MNEEFEFEAVIQAGDRGGAFVLFPFDMLHSFGTAGKVAVCGTIDSVAFRGTLLKYGSPQYLLGVVKSLRSEIGKGPGDTENHVEAIGLRWQTRQHPGRGF